MKLPMWFIALALAHVMPLSAHAQEFRWSEAVLRQHPAWYASSEARRIAENVVRHQSAEGGWPKNTNLAEPPAGAGDAGMANTFDNAGTTLPMAFLARVISAGDARHRPAFERGIDYMLAAQYPNGGWPQFYPLRGGYYDHVTFNDDAMIGVMSLLRDVANAAPPYAFVDSERRAHAAAAVERGVDLILRTQIRQNGVLTVWCAQYDAQTLAPAWARRYEPPSLSGLESVGVVRFLMSIEAPSPAVAASIEAAIAWFEASAITGLRIESFTDAAGASDRRLVADPQAQPLWARFYEIGANRPIFIGRDSVIRYSFAEIERERRAGYNYYGDWAGDLLDRDYPRWRARTGRA